MGHILDEQELAVVFPVVLSKAMDLPSIQLIARAAGAGGLLVARSGAAGDRTGMGSRNVVRDEIAKAYTQLGIDQKRKSVPAFAAAVIQRDPSAEAPLQKLLGAHGYQFIEGEFIPVGLLDSRELQHLPASPGAQLAAATAELSKGNWSRAIGAACGAIDSATLAAYKKHNLGAPPNSFQAKVNTVFQQLKVFSDLDQQWTSIGCDSKDVEEIAQNLRKALPPVAEALQTMRRTMGNVHGEKPADEASAYVSVKLAQLICGLLKNRV